MGTGSHVPPRLPTLPGCFALAQLCVPCPPLYFQYGNKCHFWLVPPAAACSACQGGAAPSGEVVAGSGGTHPAPVTMWGCVEGPSPAPSPSSLHPWVMGRGETALTGAGTESLINLHKYADEQRGWEPAACRR